MVLGSCCKKIPAYLLNRKEDIAPFLDTIFFVALLRVERKVCGGGKSDEKNNST